MATTTTNLGLTQPDEAEGYDVAVFNANADIIDNAVGTLQRTLGDEGDGIGAKVDALQADMTAVKTDTATVMTNTTAINDRIGAGEENDTLFSILQSMKTMLATNKRKSFSYAKSAAASNAWQTVCNIKGAGVIDKALCQGSSSATLWQMRITVDDEVVFYCSGNANDWAGAVKDSTQGTSNLYVMALNASGVSALNPMNASLVNGLTGSNSVSACVSMIPRGILFNSSFKLEILGVAVAVNIGGEITETAEVTTI